MYLSKYLILFVQTTIHICYCLFKLLSSTRIGAKLPLRSFNVQIGKCIFPNCLLYLSKYLIVFFQCPLYRFVQIHNLICPNSNIYLLLFVRTPFFDKNWSKAQIIQCPNPNPDRICPNTLYLSNVQYINLLLLVQTPFFDQNWSRSYNVQFHKTELSIMREIKHHNWYCNLCTLKICGRTVKFHF